MADVDLVSAKNEVTKELLATGGIDSNISNEESKSISAVGVQSDVAVGSTLAKTVSDDPLVRAEKYLSKHDVIELFQHMTSEVAYRRPRDVIDHMIEYITRLQEEAMVRRGIILTSSSSSKNS